MLDYELIPLPRYNCHKEVKAFKIEDIQYRMDGDLQMHAVLIPKEKELLPAYVTGEWIAKHTPVPGGYFVCYKDGYESYSPAAPFEEGYSLMEDK